MFTIKTARGKYYEVNDKNEIIRKDVQDFKPSGQRFAVGIKRVLPFGRLGETEAIKKGDFTFKNGRGTYCLVDYDYGTYRIWSDRIIAIR